jgi:hypothetical protein
VCFDARAEARKQGAVEVLLGGPKVGGDGLTGTRAIHVSLAEVIFNVVRVNLHFGSVGTLMTNNNRPQGG